MNLVKSPAAVRKMRTSGRLLAEVIHEVRQAVEAGVTTAELDALTESETRKRGAVPAFKGYQVGRDVFPASLCASKNDQVVHGIPDDEALSEGDLISLDFGLSFDGYYADSAFSVYLGKPPPRVQELLDVTEAALYTAVSCAKSGARVGDLGNRIQTKCEAAGFGVVRNFVGHGIGERLHEEPAVPNFGKRGTGLSLRSGMCLAIEPMVTMGSARTITLGDRWTVVTRDGSLAAHFEHTVLLTDDGPEILTTLD
ncbi:MAG: type I methionyl aminopeptidase [Proteobacteria bacterium]|nr:type I methionyl aminopeptidase [Pseudomonadota bacterium]MCP4918223.1 type I methionyl aminopeptidase [Pseudomonadota bacterium]